jgi:toxin-antitoxin system PIN domain toxin
MRALLDVNVLIALLDQDHVHHGRAREWLVGHSAAGWASCPLTQNGCVRIMSQPGYPNALTTSEVMERLALATRHPSHAFWPADITLLDEAVADRSRIHGPRQVTDLYLLALAVKHGGCLATLDGTMTASAVRGASKRHLVVI